MNRIIKQIIKVLGINIDNKRKSYKVPDGVVDIQARVADVYGDAKAIVSVVSDDGFYVSGVNLDSIFGKRNIKCTVAGAVCIMEPFKNEWNRLLKNGTIDVVNHSYSHLEMKDGEDVNALKHEIIDAGEWLEELVGHKQIAFACPYNQMCEDGYRILADNDFWAVRRGVRGWNSLSPEEGIEKGQWFNLMTQGIGDEGVNTAIRNGWVDVAIKDETWLIEMWHNVMEEDDGLYQTILLPEAEAHLEYLVEKSNENAIWVATYTEAVKYLREKQNSKIYSYIDKKQKLHIYVELTNDKMSYKIFCHPLTILVKLPMKVKAKSVEYLNENTIMINVVPGRECVIDLIRE